MREFRMMVLLLAALVACDSAARAAEKKLVPEEGAFEVMLLRQKAVQDDLNLTAEESRQIKEFTDKQWKRAQEIEEGDTATRDKTYDEMTKENHKFVHDVLEPPQRKRLHQIMLQVAGLMSVTNPHVASEIKLTDEQKARARSYQEEARKEMRDLIHSETAAGKQEKLDELRMTSRKRLLDLLTDEQETKWKEMTGAPFTRTLDFSGR